MKKVIFFDLDNTLIDRVQAVNKAYKEMAEIQYPGDLIMQDKLYNAFIKYDENGDTDILKRFQNVKDELGFDQDWVFDEVDVYYKVYPDKTVPYKESRECLETLKKKYRLGLITNGTMHGQLRKLELSGLKDYFETVTVSAEIGVFKPGKKIFDLACEKMNCKAEDCFYIGDIPWRDIAGSYRAGMSPILICAHGEKPCKDFPYIYNIGELPKLLEEIDK